MKCGQAWVYLPRVKIRLFIRRMGWIDQTVITWSRAFDTMFEATFQKDMLLGQNAHVNIICKRVVRVSYKLNSTVISFIQQSLV